MLFSFHSSAFPLLVGGVALRRVTSALLSLWAEDRRGFPLLLLVGERILWVKDVLRERRKEGARTAPMKTTFNWGIVLFILSEVFFFLGLFWNYYNRAFRREVLFPSPPVLGFAPLLVPFLNTRVLLLSGVWVTLAHRTIKRFYLFLTVLLGGYFTYLQEREYKRSFFSFSEALYGNRFYLLTGAHGLHVLAGTCLLLVGLSLFKRMGLNQVSLEAGIWYWHFVDVVWVFLFLGLYCLN